MSDESRSEIDPRFNPAFQRGFDPETAPQTPPNAPRQPPSAPSFVIAPASGGVVSPPPVPSAPVPPALPAPEAHANFDAEQPARQPVGDAMGGRNPYLIVLGVVAVVLVGIGVWLFMQSTASFDSKAVRSQGAYMSLGATIQAAPFVSLLGVAVAIGVVFVFAVRWRRH